VSDTKTRNGAGPQALVTEYEYEPVAGLPERLPPGEEILWQGTPRWPGLARYAFHVRKVAAYFLILALLTLVWDLQGGTGLAGSLANLSWLAVAAALSIVLLTMLARAMARSTLYTITNRRVAMRFGVALPMTINLPFSKVRSAALRENPDGTGDIPLTLDPKARVAYWVLWPHARPWRFGPAEPMLRAIPEAASVGRRLADALRAYAQAAGQVQAVADAGAADPTGASVKGEASGQDRPRRPELAQSGPSVAAL
jgi:hypothetical protein